jgi:RNA polymerase sigma-70 factor (ECF subfamily)
MEEVIPDQELLAKAKIFDQAALGEIYDLYSPRIYRYAIRLLGDACAAEDCVAETFSRFLQALHANRGPRDYLQAYLFRTAHNLVVDHYRRGEPGQALDPDRPDESSTEEIAGWNIRTKRLRAALRQLTPDQQQVIALKFLEGWENEEIAQILNKPVGAVKSLQHRALASLQKLLFEEENSYGERTDRSTTYHSIG